MKPPYLFLLFLLINTSCINLQPIKKTTDRLQTLNAQTIHLLDGEYKVTSLDSTYFKLIDAFWPEHRSKRKVTKVAIKVIDTNHLRVTSWDEKGIIRSKNVRGEISKNYF